MQDFIKYELLFFRSALHTARNSLFGSFILNITSKYIYMISDIHKVYIIIIIILEVLIAIVISPIKYQQTNRQAT